MNKYYYLDPSEESARWHMHGEPRASVVAQASKLATEIGKSIPVSYENITASGTVKETGDYAICHASGKVHYTGHGK